MIFWLETRETAMDHEKKQLVSIYLLHPLSGFSCLFILYCGSRALRHLRFRNHRRKKNAKPVPAGSRASIAPPYQPARDKDPARPINIRGPGAGTVNASGPTAPRRRHDTRPHNTYTESGQSLGLFLNVRLHAAKRSIFAPPAVLAVVPQMSVSTLGLQLKLLELNGIYPLTAFGAKQPPPARSRAISPEMPDSVKSVTPEPTDVETRKIVNMMCDVKAKEESCDLMLTIVLRMDDKMNRQLTSCIAPGDNPRVLAQELVHYGFINEVDRDKIAALIEDTLQNASSSGNTSPTHNSFQSLPAAVTCQPPTIITAVPPLTTIVTAVPAQVPMHSTS